MFWRFKRLPVSDEEINELLAPLMQQEEIASYRKGLKRSHFTGGPTISGYDAAYDEGLSDGLSLREGTEAWRSVVTSRVAAAHFQKAKPHR